MQWLYICHKYCPKFYFITYNLQTRTASFPGQEKLLKEVDSG